MRKRLLIVLLLSMLADAPTWGGEIAVLLTVDKTTVSIGDTILAQVIVKGARQTEPPELHNMNGFDVSPSGRSNRVNIVNGVVDSETIFSFRLIPKHPGAWVIGPAVTTVSGNTFRSGQVKMIVQSGSMGTLGGTPGAPQTPGVPQAPQPEKRNFYITADVDNLRPYIGEQIVYTFRLYNRANLARAEMKLPDFAGFLKEELGKQRAYNEVINGVTWHVAEIKYALFPLLGGEMTIPPAVLMVDVIVAGRAERVTVPSQSISLLVSRTPSAGKPQEYSGLVGHVTLVSSVSKRTIRAGESTTLTLTVQGDANIRDFQWVMPKQTEFNVYDDKPTFEIASDTRHVTGTKVLKKALVPVKGGEIEIPKITVAYFDPNKKAYRFAEAKAIRLNVSGTGGEKTLLVSGETAQKKEVAVLGRDLMPIKRGLNAVNNDAISSSEKGRIVITLSLGSIFYSLLVMLKTRRDRLLGDFAYRRRTKAYKQFNAFVKTISAETPADASFSFAFRTYLGDRFNLDGGALTSADTDPKLRPLGVSGETIQKIEMFLKTCEEAQYGGRTNENLDVPMEALTKLVLEIEKGEPR